VKQDESNSDVEFMATIELGGKLSSHLKIYFFNLENGKNYVKTTKTPYQNIMLNIRVLKTEERSIRHKLFLP
jgi:hypothetical protein